MTISEKIVERLDVLKAYEEGFVDNTDCGGEEGEYVFCEAGSNGFGCIKLPCGRLARFLALIRTITPRNGDYPDPDTNDVEASRLWDEITAAAEKCGGKTSA